MDEKIVDNIKELIDKRSIDTIIKESVVEIRLCKKSVWQYIIAIIFGAVIAVVASYSYGTVNVMKEVSELLFDTSIGIIGLVLSAYSIFQALIQKELIKVLIKSDDNLLKRSNKTFLNIVVLYVINALISLIARIILSAIGKEFIIFENIKLCNFFSVILIFGYMTFNLLLLLELIVFTVNLYRMFCVHNTINAIDAVKDDEQQNE